MESCIEFKRNGLRCSCPARPNSKYCSFHDPELAANRMVGRRKGGHARHGRKFVPVGNSITFNTKPTVEQISEILWKEFRVIDSFEPSQKKAYTLAYLSQTLLKVIEVSDLQDRIVELERLFGIDPQ